MRKLFYLVVSIVIFGLIISGCIFHVVPPSGQDGSIDIVKNDVFFEIDLIAGQHTVAGFIAVSDDDESLYITYETEDNWLINETHLYVGTTIPTNSIPGKFPYKHEELEGVTTDTYEIPLEDLGVESSDTIYIAAHAELVKGATEETGWAEGIEIKPGKNWAMYFEYQLSWDEFSDYEKLAITTDRAIDKFVANCEIYGEEQAKQMIIDELLEKEKIIDAGIGIDNESIWFQWENGIISSFSEYPEMDDYQKVPSRSFDNLEIITDSKGIKNTPENNKAIIFDWENTDANTTQNKIIQNELEYGGYDVEYRSKSKSEFTLYELENIHEYGVIYIDSHGGANDGNGINVLTGEEISDEVMTYFRDKYGKNYVSMIGWHTFYENINGQEVPTETYFTIYPNFITETAKNEYYPKSLVYFGTCYSLADTSMADAFIYRGAYAYCGYTGKSLSDNDVDMSVFHYLLYGGWDLLSAINYSIPTPPLNFYAAHFYPENHGDLYLVCSEEEKIENSIQGFFQALSEQNWDKARNYCVNGSMAYEAVNEAELEGFDNQYTIENIDPIIVDSIYSKAYVYFHDEVVNSETWFYLEEIGGIWKIYEWDLIPGPQPTEPPVEFMGELIALTSHSTRSRSVTHGTLNDDSSRILYYSDNLGDTVSRGGIYHAIDVSWWAYDNCTGYRVYRSINGSEYEIILDWDTTGIVSSGFGLYDSDIALGNTYSYYVTAYNDTEKWETVPSNIYSIEIGNETFLPPIYLNQPQDYGIVDNPNYLFKWTPVGNILPYGDVVEGKTWLRIFDADTLSSLWTPLYSDNFTTSQVTYNGNPLISGNTYRWVVRNFGYDTNGQIIAESRSEYWEFTYEETTIVADISGNWSGEYDPICNISGQMWFYFTQSGSNFIGEGYDINGATSEISGELNGNNFIFTMNQTNPECPGYFEGTGTINGDTLFLNFSGNNCVGSHQNVIVNANRIDLIEGSVPALDIRTATWLNNNYITLYIHPYRGSDLDRGYKAYKKVNEGWYNLFFSWAIGPPEEANLSSHVKTDYNVEVGSSYSYYVIAYGNGWETFPNDVSSSSIDLDSQSFLPPVSLISPQNNFEIDDPHYIFEWNPVGINESSLPYGNVAYAITTFDISEEGTHNLIWRKDFNDMTTNQITYNGPSLTTGYNYSWKVVTRGYDSNGNWITYSMSEDWQFTYIANDIIDGQITDVSPLTDPFDLDAWYTTNVYVKNTGNVSHTFKVRGLKPSGSDFQDGTEKFLTIDPGVTKSVPFTYQFYGTETCRSLTFYLYDNSGNLLDTKQTGTLCPNITYPPDTPTLNDFTYCPWSGVNYSLTWS
jgi:hypothetical protein